MVNTPSNTYWHTKDGRRILVANMEESHVNNCVKILCRSLGLRYDPTLSNKEYLCKLITALNLQQTLFALTLPNN